MKRLWKNAAIIVGISLCLLLTLTAVYAAEGEMVEEIIVDGGYFVEDFDPNVHNYDVYLASYITSVDVSVLLSDERFAYSVDGGSVFQTQVTVTVYDPKGEYGTQEYYLVLHRTTGEVDELSWIGLTYLGVENGTFAPQFDRYRAAYYVVLENDIDSYEAVGVQYRTVSFDAEVSVTCRGELNEDGTLPEGTRIEYQIQVTEKDGRTKTYRLFLYRKAYTASPLSETARLSAIKINGGAVPVSPFSANKAYYEIDVPESVQNIDVQAVAVDKSDIVEVIGPTFMNKDVATYINIIVTSPSDNTSSIYTLRLEYKSFFFSAVYSKLHVLVYVMLACVLGGIFGSVLSYYKSDKKYIKERTSAAARQKFGTCLFGGYNKRRVVNFIERQAETYREEIKLLQQDNALLKESVHGMEQERSELDSKAKLQEESAAYVEELEQKLEQMDEEMLALREECEKLREPAQEYLDLKESIAAFAISTGHHTEEFQAEENRKTPQVVVMPQIWSNEKQEHDGYLNQENLQRLYQVTEMVDNKSDVNFERMLESLQQLEDSLK